MEAVRPGFNQIKAGEIPGCKYTGAVVELAQLVLLNVLISSRPVRLPVGDTGQGNTVLQTYMSATRGTTRTVLPDLSWQNGKGREMAVNGSFHGSGPDPELRHYVVKPTWPND